MLITVILARIQAWLKYRANLRELSALSDRDLADIGVSRSGLEAAVRAAMAK